MADLLNTGIQTTNRRLFIVNVDTLERLEIQFVPDKVAIARDADLATIKIVGRNNPKYQDTGGETSMTLTLDFYADEQARTSVVRKCNWLMALTYTDKGRKPSPRVSIVFGSLFKNEIWKVKSVRPSYSMFSEGHDFMPRQAYVDITLVLDVDYNRGWEDVNVIYASGEPDGTRPVPSGQARIDPENNEWRTVVNDNSFDAIARRAVERLGIDLRNTASHGYGR